MLVRTTILSTGTLVLVLVIRNSLRTNFKTLSLDVQYVF